MKILSWNTPRLGNLCGIRFLQDLISKEGSDVMFLQEKKLLARTKENKKYFFGFFNCIVIDCEERGRGLAILWTKEVVLSVRDFSKNHIHANIYNMDESEHSWMFTSIYGHPEGINKSKTWALINQLGAGVSRPWLLGGDFNEVLFVDEK